METQEQVKSEQEKKSEFATGFALDGNMVKNLKDKNFLVAGYRTDKFKDFKDSTKEVERIVLIVKLADGTIVDYFPNKSSQKVLIAKRGFKYADWVGFAGEFETLAQRIGEITKDVIYIKK